MLSISQTVFARKEIQTTDKACCGDFEMSVIEPVMRCLILVLNKKLEKLFIAPKVRQELHETTFVAFATKGQRE